MKRLGQPSSRSSSADLAIQAFTSARLSTMWRVVLRLLVAGSCARPAAATFGGLRNQGNTCYLNSLAPAEDYPS